MLDKFSKWYKSLNILCKGIIWIFFLLIVLSLFWTVLSWLGIWSSYIKKINTSNIGKDWLKGFVYALKFLFVNENNKLNWIAVGAVGVLVSYWITVKENAKKIDADLKAKARIKWIQDVRKEAAVLVADSQNLLGYFPQFTNGIKRLKIPHEMYIINVGGIQEEYNQEVHQYRTLLEISHDDKEKFIKYSHVNNVYIHESCTPKMGKIDKERLRILNDLIKKRISLGNSYCKPYKTAPEYSHIIKLKVSKKLHIHYFSKPERFGDVMVETKSDPIMLKVHNDDSSNLKEKIDLINNLKKTCSMLVLYFGPDKSNENQEIVDLVEKIEATFDEENLNQEDIANFRNNVNLFRDKIREYLKREWDKAKEGK